MVSGEKSKHLPLIVKGRTKYEGVRAWAGNKCRGCVIFEITHIARSREDFCVSISIITCYTIIS